MSNLTCKVTELPDAIARVEIEISPATVDERVMRTAKEMGGELKIQGFRKGHVPPEIVLQRVGREALLERAIDSSLDDWYFEALRQSELDPVGSPKMQSLVPPAEGEPLRFSLDVPIVPEAKLGEFKGVEVGRREPAVDPGAIDHELEHLRDHLAKLETIDRPSQTGDFVLIDFVGSIDEIEFEGGTARDYLLELGAGRMIAGFEEQITGGAAGEERELNVTFPDDYPGEEVAGKDAVFQITIKEVKHKVLPELSDEFAVEAGGFDTVDELKTDIEKRLAEQAQAEIDNEFRTAVLDAVAANATVNVPKGHIHSRAHQIWHRMAETLARQGVDPRAYLQATGKDEEEFVVEAEPEAEKSLRREATIAALIEQEKIRVNEQDMIEAITPAAEQQQTTPADLLKQIREAGSERQLKRDIAVDKASDLLVEHAKPIPIEQAEARDAIWTPDKEAEAEGSGGAQKQQLWTPGS